MVPHALLIYITVGFLSQCRFVIVPFFLLYPFLPFFLLYPFCYCAVFVIVSCLLLRSFCCRTLLVFVTVPFLLLCLLLYPFWNRFCLFVTVPFLLLYPFCYCALFVTVPFSLTSGTRSSPVTAPSDVTCVGEKAHAALLCRQCHFLVICAVFT